VPRPPSSATFTSEFGHELETERIAWLRRRFLWYSGILVVVTSTMAIVNLLFSKFEFHGAVLAVFVLTTIVSVSVHVAAFAYVWRNPMGRFRPLGITFGIILGLGTLSLITAPIMTSHIGDQIAEQMEQARAAGKPGAKVVAATPKMTVEFDTSSPPEPNEAPEAGEGAGDRAEGKTAKAPRKTQEERDAEFARIVTVVRQATPIALGAWAGLVSIFSSHFIACLLLPWTPRESMRPIWPLLGLNAALTGVYVWQSSSRGLPVLWGIGAMVVAVIASLFVPLPGLAVCWWRHGRFRKRKTYDLLRGRYSELKHELTYAQQIHEGLFPDAIRNGSVRFEYVYEPMRQIGGDYLHAFAAPDGRHSFVVMDVTGHGIPAALTVNRLHGELTRIFAEDPDIAPGDVLTLLNRYVHLTLATHSVYVTAICFRVCARTGTLEYASGGHPPAFVRDVRGHLEQLDSTTFVLGACAGNDFQHEQRTVPFGPGDVLVAYTDGATEARDQHGRYFGIAGIQRHLATGAPLLDHDDGSGGWPGAIRQAVERHRYGPTADDILVIEIRRPVQ